MLQYTINNNIDELVFMLEALDDTSYQLPVVLLSNATIGQHVRHIIEMYICLADGYNSGIVNYDNRKRNKDIEANRNVALAELTGLKDKIAFEDKTIMLENTFNSNFFLTQSSYQRELLYNLEHSIHHQALIKVALLDINHNIVDENFGVAQSTIEYRKKCVQ